MDGADGDGDRGPLALALVAQCAPLDFRDAKSLATTCTHARLAVKIGPLALITDCERKITTENLSSLFGFLRWCGDAVRELRLEQQPRALWELPVAAMTEEQEQEPLLFWGARRNAEDAIRREMPTNHSILLHRLAERCTRLQTLSIEHFSHPHCDLTDQGRWRAAITNLLPDAFPSLSRLHLASAFQFDRSESGGQASVSTDYELAALVERTCINQLDMTLGPAATSGLLSGAPHASRRLLQLDVCDLPSAAVHQVCNVCTQLQRLRLAQCELGLHRRAPHEPLTSPALSALPPTLKVLELIGCDATVDATPTAGNAPASAAQAEATSFELELLLPHLQHLELQINNLECGPKVSFGAGDCFASLPELRSLDVCGQALFGDAELSTVGRCCRKLHTLIIAHTCVTARGLRSLWADPDATNDSRPAVRLPLPRLRVCLYLNIMFESDLADFLAPPRSIQTLEQQQAQALADDAEKDHFIEHAGDVVASHAEADELIRAFFAFCVLAVERDLVVPFETNAATWRQVRPYMLASCFALEYE